MQNENVKFNLYRIKNIILQKKYFKNTQEKNINDNMIKSMNKHMNNLKNIHLIYKTSDIEAIKYGSTSYPDTLFKDELINRYCFFSIILGFIDANINYTNNDILYYTYLRNIICSDLINSKYNSDPKYLSDFLVNKLTNNDIIFDKIIYSSYLIGYTNYNLYSIDYVYNEYLRLLNDFNKYKSNNIIEVNKIRVKKKIIQE